MEVKLNSEKTYRIFAINKKYSFGIRKDFLANSLEEAKFKYLKFIKKYYKNLIPTDEFDKEFNLIEYKIID